MDWAQTLTERYLSTPGISWVRNNNLNLLIDGKHHLYSNHHYDLAALMGRSIKRGQDMGVFLPRLSDADLAFVLTFPYVIATNVRVGLSLPGHWLNRRNLGRNPHIMTIGHGPKQRQLLVNRTRIGRQEIQDYLGVYWPSRSRKHKDNYLFEGVGQQRDTAIYIVPESKVTENNLRLYSEECQPFVILYDLTYRSHVDKQTAKRIEVLKAEYPETPIFFVCATGNISAMTTLRGENISTWIMRANDIQRLDKYRKPQKENSGTGLTINSRILENGITVNLQVIEDETMDSWLQGLMSLLNRISQALKSDKESTDQPLFYEAAIILRDLTALVVPLSTLEELHQSERRVGLYATKLLRNRIESLDRKRGSVGETNDLLNSFVRDATIVSEILINPTAETGKCCSVIKWAKHQQDNQSLSIIACPNESIKRAMITTLSRHDLDTINGSVNVLTQNETWEIGRNIFNQDTHLYWIGALDYYCGAFFGGLFADITIAIYPCEREGVERQMYFLDRNTQKGSRRYGDKLLFLQDKKSCIRDSEVDEDSESQWLVNWTSLNCEGKYPGDIPEVKKFELPSAEWIQEWLDEPPAEPSPPVCSTNDPCVVITLSDGGPDITLPLSAGVMVLDEINNDQDGIISATNLYPGLTILVPRDDPKRTLIDRLVDTLRNDPEFFLQERMAERWYDAIEIIRSRTGGNTEAALTLLQEQGVDVETPQAIYGWFNHLVIGPRTRGSLKAVALTAEMPDIIKNINLIWGSILYVRRVRKKLALQIANYVRAGMSQYSDKLIDKDLKLYRSDLEDLTRIGEILHIYQQGTK